MPELDNTLAERGNRYGRFDGHAWVTQQIKDVMHHYRRPGQTEPQWAFMTDSQKEALDMIAHKIGRIINGDPNYADSWHDIAGYSKLVEDELNGDSK